MWSLKREREARRRQIDMLRWLIDRQRRRIEELEQQIAETKRGKPFAVFKDCDCIKRGFEDAREAQYGRCRCGR